MRKIGFIIIGMLLMWACGDVNLNPGANAQLMPQQASTSLDSPVTRAIGQNDEVSRFLKKHKVAENKHAEVRKLVNAKSMTSAVREVQQATQLPLPKAKAIVDTLFQIVHGVE